MELNTQQKQAVEHKSGPLLIIAGAGTGKTKVITERIGHIIKKKWARPSEILALTFTEKAAAEMQERVDMILPITYEQPLLATFHSFADQILRQESLYIGLDSNYKLMTQSEAYILFRQHLFEFPLVEFRPLGNPTKFISGILSHFSRLQDEDVSPDEYIKYATSLPEGNDIEKKVKTEALELSNTYKKYGEIKVSQSKLDFGDLIYTVLQLFRNKPNILKKYHDRFKYILVDEYQDTNYTQNILVNLLVLGKEVKESEQTERDIANITVVGDDDQAIYKFRGAAISNILQFKQIYPNAKNVVLTQNYRSNQEILDVSYKLIKNNDPYRLEVTEKINKRLISNIEFKENTVKLIRTNNSDFEAERISKEILNLVGRGNELNAEFDAKGQSSFLPDDSTYKYNDIAILARANSHIDEIIDTLRFYEIPYKLGGSRSLYQRPEIQILISFLKTVADYSDEVSMFNILSMKDWGFSARDLVEIMKEARKEKSTVFEKLEGIEKKYVRLTTNGKSAVKKITAIYKKAYEMLANGKGAGEILFHFFENSGLKDKYLEDESGKYSFVVDNTRKYFDMLKAFWRNNPNTNIYEYLDYLNYSLEVGESPSVDNEAFEDYDAVNILTIHSAKGLEFPIVFVINMVNDRFPSRDRKDAIPIPDALIKELLSGKGEESEHLMEERRLAYVAFTRAKDKLYLTASDFYSEGKRKKKLSPFIYESLGEGKIPDTVEESKNKKEINVREGKDLLVYESLGLKASSSFSYTQIHKYEMCPLEYKYEYVLKIPTPISGPAYFGSTIHNTLKQVYEQLQASKLGLEGFIHVPTLSEALTMYERNWISLGYDDKKHEEKRKESGVKLLELYFKELFSKSDNPMHIERGFDYAIDDFKIKGRIDRIDLLKDDGGKKYVEIIDYKTGKAKDVKEAQKEWQLQLYAYIVEETMGLIVSKASYIYVESGQKVEVKVDAKRKKEVLDNIREIVKKIREGDFTIPKNHDCRFCTHREICEDAII